MNTQRLISSAKFVVATLVGAFAIHGVLAACSGGDTKNANAQGLSCSQWEYTSMRYSDMSQGASYTTAEGNTANAKLIPGGFEPFAEDTYGVRMRRCAK